MKIHQITEDENDWMYKIGRGISRILKGDPNWEPDKMPGPMDDLDRQFADAAGISYDTVKRMAANPQGSVDDWIGNSDDPRDTYDRVGKAGSAMHYAGGRGEPTDYDVHKHNFGRGRAAINPHTGNTYPSPQSPDSDPDDAMDLYKNPLSPRASAIRRAADRKIDNKMNKDARAAIDQKHRNLAVGHQNSMSFRKSIGRW